MAFPGPVIYLFALAVEISRLKHTIKTKCLAKCTIEHVRRCSLMKRPGNNSTIYNATQDYVDWSAICVGLQNMFGITKHLFSQNDFFSCLCYREWK